MKIILLRGKGRAPIKFSLGIWHLLVPVLLLLNLLLVVLFVHQDSSNLTQRVAMLEAQTQRLSQLGRFIARKTQLDINAFNLDQKPAIGGISGDTIEPGDKWPKKFVAKHKKIPETDSVTEEQLLKSIQQSENRLKKQQKRLDKFSNLVTIQQKPHFLNPLKTGYISSKYGMRNDPINGSHRFHQGIDLAGVRGSPIEAIASGFVTFAGHKGGYGNVVEIHHSDSLKSRYAHLDKILVKKGSVVRQGNKIGTLGATGRVTGPHLHLEVWKNGKAVNPEKYLNLALGVLAQK